MEKLFCSKCGNEIEGSAMFCSKCGSEVVLKLKSDETDNSKVKNPFTKFIFITIAIQIIAIVIMLLIDGNIGGTAFGFAVLILPIFVLIFSVLTLIKSKKYNNKGKLVGIIFMILSFLLLFF